MEAEHTVRGRPLAQFAQQVITQHRIMTVKSALANPVQQVSISPTRGQNHYSMMVQAAANHAQVALEVTLGHASAKNALQGTKQLWEIN